MQRLPNPPHAIQHGVMKEERGIIGAAENVACVTANGEVAGGVEAEEAVVETALELVLEGFDVGGGGTEGEVVEVGVCEPVFGGGRGEVAF